jgi:phospholipid/cholesterol/gamma-HCH transport system substrate-binding protein
VKVAIRKHLGDFLAILALFILALGIAGYILSQQRLKFPVVQEKPFEIKAELENAQAVQPGQGQTVRVAGVKVGDIGEVELEDGRAVVTLQIERKYKDLIREDASALLRSKTGLKDMFLEIDPGEGEPLEEKGRIQIANTAQDVDPDEILSVLDRDTRDYLRLLISGAGKGLNERGTDLREVFRRFGPLHRDLARVSTAIARRRNNLQRLIHNYGSLVTEVGRSDDEVARLVQQSRAVFESFAAEDQNISEFVARLPGTLRTTRQTLEKVDVLGQRMPPALNALVPAFRQLDVANREVLPLVREATPIIRNEIRPFARIAQPYLRDIGEGARGLARGNRQLAPAFGRLNRFFNIGAFNPGGAEGLSGNFEQDRARSEGYLYWLAWTAQNTVSLFSTSDAIGPIRRISLGGLSCSILVAQGLPTAIVDILRPARACSS